MLKRFKSFIEEQRLCDSADRVLLAVSGGMDSVVMAELFHQAGYQFGMAHCNFRLRGSESDEDEASVRNLASGYKVPFFTKSFPTLDYAALHGISVQMAARELRYSWFEEIRGDEGFSRIATAHHLDDQIETVFINLLRGTGISGLHGILPRQGDLIRPLLFAWRSEIESFGKQHRLPFREDSSNRSVKYTRNKIRHQLIPLLHSIQPDFAGNITATVSHIRETESILKPYLEKTRKRLVRKQRDRWVIHIPDLIRLEPLAAWLYELLLPFEFNEAATRDLVRSLDKESGKIFLSPGYRIVKDRDTLIVTRLGEEGPACIQSEFLIEEGQTTVQIPVRLHLKTVRKRAGYLISSSRNIATLDKDKLVFPLILRKWKPGDYFYPYGLNKRKKLSDFFIDEKVSIPEKERTWVLCSGAKIAWVIGHRTDHRFRVTSRTNWLLEVDFLP
ncbi:MAG: tRNA lysidine(34) synthetase TilS [bacterium]